MRCLEQNKSLFYYAKFLGEVDYYEDGYMTGEKTLSYSTPAECRANISPARGSSDMQLYGTALDYDRNICFDYTNFPDLDEQSVLWIDKTPNGNDFNYRVLKIAKSKNWVNVAIKKVARG